MVEYNWNQKIAWKKKFKTVGIIASVLYYIYLDKIKNGKFRFRIFSGGSVRFCKMQTNKISWKLGLWLYRIPYKRSLEKLLMKSYKMPWLNGFK